MILIPVAAGITLYSLLSLPYMLPVLSFERLSKYSDLTNKWIPAPIIRWEDGKEHQISQGYADITCWKELAEIVTNTYNSLTPFEKRQCTIFCQRNYGYAGAIHFYGHQYQLPEPVTFPAKWQVCFAGTRQPILV